MSILLLLFTNENQYMTQDFTFKKNYFIIIILKIFRLLQAVIKFEWPSLLDCIIYKVMFSTIPNTSHKIT